MTYRSARRYFRCPDFQPSLRPDKVGAGITACDDENYTRCVERQDLPCTR